MVLLRVQSIDMNQPVGDEGKRIMVFDFYKTCLSQSARQAQVPNHLQLATHWMIINLLMDLTSVSLRVLFKSGEF